MDTYLKNTERTFKESAVKLKKFAQWRVHRTRRDGERALDGRTSMFKQDSFHSVCGTEVGQRCDYCRALRQDTNVLVLQRLSDLSTLAAVNLLLAILCVLFLASSIVCFIFNSYDNDCYPCETAVVRDEAFHRLEFSSTFAFTLVNTLALIYSPERRFRNPLLLKGLVLVNVCASAVTTLLVFYSLDHFERPSRTTLSSQTS